MVELCDSRRMCQQVRCMGCKNDAAREHCVCGTTVRYRECCIKCVGNYGTLQGVLRQVCRLCWQELACASGC